MADTKISALTAATTPLAGTEVLPIVQSGATVKVSVDNLTAGRAISATQLTLSAGNLIVANGYGIDFSATPGTGTSELFDDYEEGTWTPTFNLGTFTYTVQNGIYTKVGNVVHVTGRIEWSAKSGGDIGLVNLPFTAAASPSVTYGCAYSYLKGVDTGDKQLIGFTPQNESYMGMVQVIDNGTPVFTFINNWEAEGVVAFSITYQV